MVSPGGVFLTSRPGGSGSLRHRDGKRLYVLGGGGPQPKRPASPLSLHAGLQCPLSREGSGGPMYLLPLVLPGSGRSCCVLLLGMALEAAHVNYIHENITTQPRESHGVGD